jgi:hypothetical protein
LPATYTGTSRSSCYAKQKALSEAAAGSAKISSFFGPKQIQHANAPSPSPELDYIPSHSISPDNTVSTSLNELPMSSPAPATDQSMGDVPQQQPAPVDCSSNNLSLSTLPPTLALLHKGGCLLIVHDAEISLRLGILPASEKVKPIFAERILSMLS